MDSLFLEFMRGKTKQSSHELDAESRATRNSAELEGIKANLARNPSEQNLARYSSAISQIMAAVE